MSEQAEAIRARFEKMTDGELRGECDARNIQGRHLIKKRETLISKAVEHEMSVAAIDPGAVEAGAAPDRTAAAGGDGKRQIPTIEQAAMEAQDDADLPPLPEPPKVAPPKPPPAPPRSGMTVERGQSYVVAKDHKVNVNSFMTTIRKGSIVSLVSHSRLQEFADQGLRMRPVDGFGLTRDQLGVQQYAIPFGDDELEPTAPAKDGVGMAEYRQMMNSLSTAHTRIATLETKLEAVERDLAGARRVTVTTQHELDKATAELESLTAPVQS